MASLEPRIRKAVISGRAIFVCDNMIDPVMIGQIGDLVRTLHYIRKEKSRPQVPGLMAIAEIPTATISSDPFFHRLRQIVGHMFPDENFCDQRAYVNNSVYGDGYYAHRDCAADELHVTALYYANLQWHIDWGGETIYYNDEEDAELAVQPRPGRLVIARGAVLHRGQVPTRICYEERYTLAYKLNAISSGEVSS